MHTESEENEGITESNKNARRFKHKLIKVKEQIWIIKDENKF